jgi:hypothetical protein
MFTLFECKLNKINILDPAIQDTLLIRTNDREAFKERDLKALYCRGFVQTATI